MKQQLNPELTQELTQEIVDDLVKEYLQSNSITVLQAGKKSELLSNLVFEDFGSCGDLILVCGFNSVFERDAGDDFGEIVKAS